MLSNRSENSPVNIQATGNVPYAPCFNQISFIAQDLRHDHKNVVLHKAYLPESMPLKEAVIQAWEDFERVKPREWRKMQEGTLVVHATVEPDPELRMHAVYFGDD